MAAVAVSLIIVYLNSCTTLREVRVQLFSFILHQTIYIQFKTPHIHANHVLLVPCNVHNDIQNCALAQSHCPIALNLIVCLLIFILFIDWNDIDFVLMDLCIDAYLKHCIKYWLNIGWCLLVTFIQLRLPIAQFTHWWVVTFVARLLLLRSSQWYNVTSNWNHQGQ